MGDKATLAKARMELEEMYSGIPDESVDLTFQDLASLNNQNPNSSQKKKPTTITMEPITKVINTRTVVEQEQSPLKRSPSLDFSKGLQASIDHQHHHSHQYHLHQINENDDVHPFSTSTTPTHHHQYSNNHGHVYGHALSPASHGYGGHHRPNSFIAESGFKHAVEMSSMAHDDAMSGRSMASTYHQEKGAGRRRPGIPHSKICAICSNYVYIFRHRCLVRLTNISIDIAFVKLSCGRV